MAPRPSPSAMLKDVNVPREVMTRLKKVRSKLLRAKGAIVRGERVPTESDERLALIAKRATVQRGRALAEDGDTATVDDVLAAERIIGTDDILRVAFLGRGLLAARSVGRILILGGAETATGFLVAPHILMTNNHVLPDELRAAVSKVEFELHDVAGLPREIRQVELDPDRFWYTDKRLDISIVALAEGSDTEKATEDLGWHPMIGQQGKIRIGDAINIIQHPGGRYKSVVVHNSNLLHLENDTVLMPFMWYTTDTEPGSSGAPVFNNHWEVVGVHHRSVPRTNESGELLDADGQTISREEFRRNPDRAVWIANEGSRTSQIVAALSAAKFTRASLTQTRDELLDLWERSKLRNNGQAAAALSTTSADPSMLTESAFKAERGGSRTGTITIKIAVSP